MLSIRKATAHDAPLILDFIRRLAEYEREPDAVVATEEDIIRDGFGSEPKYRCLIAEWDGAPAGFAFFFYNYSTWLGKPACTWKIFLSCRRCAAKALAKRCSISWPRLP